MIEQLNLKNKYHIKETHIELTPSSSENYKLQIKKKILPAIMELESKSLINGFHFLLHTKIYLRISCSYWDKNESKIKKILAKHQISSDFKDYVVQENDIPNLDNNSLEFTSRLRMAYLLLEEKGKDQHSYAMMRKFPQSWIHYLYNQFGYRNLEQALAEFGSAFFQLSEALRCNQCDSDECIKILNNLKNVADDEIAKLTKQK